MLPYWLEQTLIVLPLAIWIYFGLGIPYAVLVLPRAAWARKAEVLAVSFAFGPAILTAWGFILGTIGAAYSIPLLRFDLLFGGTIVLALVGAVFAWQKRKWTERLLPLSPQPSFTASEGRQNSKQAETKISLNSPLAFDEKLLIGLMALLLLLIWLTTAYWPFTGYDTLWVYGYEGRLYTLLGYIPQHIGYYPQFLPLQYNFMQLAVGGYDDHAARVVVPFLYLGSILAAYTLGERLFSRRVGIFTAAIWALYPHAAQWAQVGDLEIPMAFLFTLSAAYFLQAWTEGESHLRRRYALIAGLCFGIAMWTKPTAGAFVWGVLLLVVADFLLKVSIGGYSPREAFRQWYPRFEVALITGLACMPLGGIWYLRNWMLDLDILVFPHASWLSLATRSGDLLSWPLLALFLMLAYLASRRRLENGWMLLLGTILILLGAMPSSPLIDIARRDSPASYIQWYESIAILAGLGLIGWGLRKYPFPSKIAWTYLLALPYFITWFWSYSYHARLSFAIVPLLILPSAVVLAGIKIRQKAVWASLIILLSLYGLAMPIAGAAPYYDWLWTDRYPDDDSRYSVQNFDVFQTAVFILGYGTHYGVTPVVIAPGEQRLSFFMPELQVITNTLPRNFEELEGASHFIYGTLARWAYADAGIEASSNRIVASLGRSAIFKEAFHFHDGNFEYQLYEVNLENRFQIPDDSASGHPITDEVIFGESIRYVSDSVNQGQLAGNQITVSFLFQAIAVPQDNYYLRLSLVNAQDESVVYVWEDRPGIVQEEGYYNTRLWEVGEYVVERRQIRLERAATYPRGANIYRLMVHFVDSETGELVPVTVNGEAVEGYMMETNFSNGN
jgi:hypothetical protein